MIRRRVAILILLVLGSASAGPLGAQAVASTSDSARAYLSRALDLIQTRSIRRDSIDWAAFRSSVMEEAGGAQTSTDTYGAIRIALQRLGDRHSFFIEPVGSVAAANVPAPDARRFGVGGVLLERRFGLISVPGFASGPSALLRRFAEDIQAHIARVDESAPCAWILDLRGNGGGNMWPMLAGLGPILGDGHAGFFVGPEGARDSWGYEAGAAQLGGEVQVRVDRPYELRTPNPTVAVLTGPRTASSGEAIVVAFRVRPNTRSFGAGTAGLSTANGTLELSDGAIIALTTSTFADRTGRMYGSIIDPDETITAPDFQLSAAADPVIQRAIAWLADQPACRRAGA